MRTYQAVSENIGTFNQFFRSHLLPVQLRHGARLIGRWQTEDDRVIAVWEYDDVDHYHQVNEAVRTDPDTHTAQEVRRTLPQLILAADEAFMTSTVADTD